MNLNRHLNLIGYNADLQRFADIHGDNLETSDIQDLAKTLYNLTDSNKVKAVNSADSVDDAFDYLDQLAEELEAKATPKLSPFTKEVYKIVCYGKYSKGNGWFNDWETIEEDYLNLLPSDEADNYTPLDYWADNEKNFNKIMAIVCRAFIVNLWEDIKGQKIGLVEKIGIIQRWRDEFEPNISDSEGFGKGEFLFESLIKCETYGELLQSFAEWVNTLIYIDWDENGNEIYGRTADIDYLHTLGYNVARADIWGAN